MTRLTLTPAQVSALQCRDGGELWAELNEASNAEDAQAVELHDRAARGASIALGNLAAKVLRS